MAILVQETGGIRSIPSLLSQLSCRRPLLVCGNSFRRTEDCKRLCDELSPTLFCAFTPNPRLSEVREGVALFRQTSCDGILAIGGGSAIDVAKCIKLFCQREEGADWLKEPATDTGVALIALPTTAGTGSEATHFAVVYHEGVKYSVAHPSLRPQAVILDPSFLSSLPPYQKACSMMDALCQAVESHWSVRATPESIALARQATETIVQYGRSYVKDHCPEAARKILYAAHQAGCAINLTTTTAPHAMSYQLTKLYSLPHGHSAALCLAEVWQEMLEKPEPCVHPLGKEGMLQCFARIAEDLGASCPAEALKLWRDLLKEYEMGAPLASRREEELTHLAASVNPARLGNNPVAFSEETLRRLYERIVK